MKYALLITMSLALIITGCKKKDSGCTYEKGTTVASAAEEAVVTNYLSTNGITGAVEVENSGLYYVVDTVGTGTKPTSMCSYINVTYSGQLSNGTYFDPKNGGTTTTVFQLGTLAEGWKRALPLIATGSTIRLFVPSSMGYGETGVYNSNTGVYTIPPNSMLVFTITLNAVSN